MRTVLACFYSPIPNYHIKVFMEYMTTQLLSLMAGIYVKLNLKSATIIIWHSNIIL